MSTTTTVGVFSHRPEVRDSIVSAIGRRPAPDLPRLTYLELTGIGEVIAEADSGRVGLLVLDGEAQPTGGMGIARQLRHELTQCPPTIVTVRRTADRWLASWSRADAVMVHPLDPLAAAETVAEVLRGHQPVAT